MKKFRLTAFLISALLLFQTTAYGVEMNLIYDEIYHYYNEDDIYIEINGEQIATKEMPPVILMDRTLVPVREVFEAIGAQVKWINETGQTSISYKGTEVLFTIGSRTVYMGRAKITIPSTDPAPMIINDKTMVPVRIVANLLGFEVDWDNDRRVVSLYESAEGIVGNDSEDKAEEDNGEGGAQTPASDSVISKITYESSGKTDLIYLTYSKPVEPDIARYDTPERVVLDFDGSQLTSAAMNLTVNGRVVSDVRGANHTDMARIVLDVSSQPNIEIYRSEDGIVIAATAASGKYTTKIGDLVNGAVYVPSDGDEEETAENTSNGTDNGSVSLDTSGTVDTTVSKNFDYNAVVIDPGHGGSDPGALGEGVRESAVTLAISLLVRDKLEADGITVVMTRTDDNTYPTLQDRVDIASRETNGGMPAVFVSIHCNSFENTESNGTQVYYHPDSKYGTILAQNIYNSNISLTPLKPGQIHDGSHLYVIRKTIQPAALVETAFISNSSDRAYLTSSAGQEALAQGIYEGIVATIKTMKADKGI